MRRKIDLIPLCMTFNIFLLFIGISLLVYNSFTEHKPEVKSKTFYTINENIILEKSERQLFALYHFKQGISDEEAKSIEKSKMINGCSKISKSTLHVYRNIFYSWEEISKMVEHKVR
jgi:hypothetical protein